MIHLSGLRTKHWNIEEENIHKYLLICNVLFCTCFSFIYFFVYYYKRRKKTKKVTQLASKSPSRMQIYDAKKSLRKSRIKLSKQ